MQEGLSFLDIIIFIVMAVFVATRFGDHELPKDKKKKRRKSSASGRKHSAQKIVRLAVKDGQVSKSSNNSNDTGIKVLKADSDKSGLEQIQELDPNFTKKSFLVGAKQAYQMYYDRFNAVDEEGLEGLLSPRLFDEVMDKVQAAEDKGNSLQVDVKKLDKADIIDARVHGQTAIVDVKYTAEQAEYSLDNKGKEVFGGKGKSKSVTTIWTWARPLNSDDPNWELEEINHVS